MPREIDELEFLSSAALALAEIGPDDDLFRFVAERLAPLAPDSLVITIAYEASTGSVAVRALVGPEEMLKAAREITGEALGQVFRVDEEARRILAEGKLVRLAGGMHQLTFRQWPVELSQRVEARLGIRSVYGQPFSRKGDFLGAVAFATRTPALEHVRLIEVFVRLAAVAIRRRRSEADLLESERRFRTLAENSQDAIFRLRIGPGRRALEYVSPAALRLTGHTSEELYADARLAAPCLYPESWIASEDLREVPPEPVIAHHIRKDGTGVWTEQNFTPTRDSSGRIVVLEGIARDITKRKEAEDALVEADRRKTEFIAVLSHELRNPLGAISNGVYLLRHVEPGGEQALRARGVIERQILQLTRLIDDLLDVTRISRGKIQLERERVELNELVKAALEDTRGAFASTKVEVEVTPAPEEVFVRADRTRLHQVVGNLLQNAAKFTPAGGRASISVHADGAHSQAVLRVQNSGAPLSPELLAHVFEPFFQADRSLDRGKGGLGLGLALVKGIVELHGGTVEAQSDERQGTVFTVWLPLDTMRQDARRPEPRRESPEAVHRRVLVIDDNVDAANTLREALEIHGNTVAVANTGDEGLEWLREHKPDVVLCDIGLPGMDGYAVARALRADRRLNDVALVAVSGYASPEDIEKSRRAGFDRHVSKPPNV